MSQESTGSRCEQLARQIQTFGRVIPTAEVLEKINAVTEADIRRAAARHFRAAPTLATVGPSRRCRRWQTSWRHWRRRPSRRIRARGKIRLGGNPAKEEIIADARDNGQPVLQTLLSAYSDGRGYRRRDALRLHPMILPARPVPLAEEEASEPLEASTPAPTSATGDGHDRQAELRPDPRRCTAAAAPVRTGGVLARLDACDDRGHRRGCRPASVGHAEPPAETGTRLGRAWCSPWTPPPRASPPGRRRGR